MPRSTSPEGFGMYRTTHEGGCHCGNLRWRLETARTTGEIAPRGCDCDFCSRYRAAWVSDSQGMLRVEAHHSDRLPRYRQGSRQADFLVCGSCGVLVAVIANREDGRLLGAVNSNAFDHRDGFAETIAASLRLLPAEATLERWTQLWTPVALQGVD